LRHVDPVFAVGCSLAGQGLVALIGQDLLRGFLLVYDGLSGTFVLAT